MRVGVGSSHGTLQGKWPHTVVSGWLETTQLWPPCDVRPGGWHEACLPATCAQTPPISRPECSTVLHFTAGHPSSPGAVARLNHGIGDGSEDRAGHAPDRRPAAGDARRDGLSAVGSGCDLVGCLRAGGHARSCSQQAQSQCNGAGHGGLEKGRPAVEGGRKRRETKPVGGEGRRAAASLRDTWLNQTLDRRRRSAAGARPMCLLNLPNAVQDLTAQADLNGSRALAVPVLLAHDGCCFGLCQISEHKHDTC